MPAVSAAQRAWAFAVKGAAWAHEHHFDNEGPLPEHKRTAARKALHSMRRRKR